MLALPAPVESRMMGKSRDFRITPSKKTVNREHIQMRLMSQDDDISVRLKKNLII